MQSKVLLTDGLEDEGMKQWQRIMAKNIHFSLHAPLTLYHDKINTTCGAWPPASIRGETASKKRINKSISLHQPMSLCSSGPSHLSVKFHSAQTLLINITQLTSPQMKIVYLLQNRAGIRAFNGRVAFGKPLK